MDFTGSVASEYARTSSVCRTTTDAVTAAVTPPSDTQQERIGEDANPNNALRCPALKANTQHCVIKGTHHRLGVEQLLLILSATMHDQSARTSRSKLAPYAAMNQQSSTP